jgi:hypothetical protein
MGSYPRETNVPSKMTREELQSLVVGLCEHRLAAIEERVAAQERAIHSNTERIDLSSRPPSPYPQTVMRNNADATRP